MSDEMTVRLTLKREVAERLRGMCHARGKTASELVTEWIAKYGSDAMREIAVEETSRRMGAFADAFFREMGKGAPHQPR